jgi:hypothetical protein
MFSRYLSIAAALFSVFSGVASRISAAENPDMVVFLSDDHTWRDSSVYGSPDINTPNMQRLANAGMTFNHAFVASPSCAPSRAALLTGLFPANNGAEPNHSRPHADLKKLPAYLQDVGYEVVSFGKVGHYAQTVSTSPDIFDITKTWPLKKLSSGYGNAAATNRFACLWVPIGRMCHGPKISKRLMQPRWSCRQTMLIRLCREIGGRVTWRPSKRWTKI